ncbi:ferric enterobactin receptor [Orbus hercynius]|uniref:Ferric enterobactin receptor n=1 Tax=Orbus hercynius TaxID=593135 RepID=A0A495RJC3_9GAMM|nr:FepA family TonB-dependent siderophore receptor [Orbus hercynius]RKS87642.1 ferric enterobactin receptor [Orbus hercynius]
MAVSVTPQRSVLSYLCSCAILSLLPFTGFAAEKEDDVITVTATSAEEMLKQQLGASIITSEDIENSPPVNDLSDIIRKQPGVNLTGNSASGARGNNRQIDIRGMGPENTLILIDGKPVTSRNAVRYSWSGERDTRGDSNWVPVEQVERVEVLRGPAAARYGSGAAGGVVNIITKKPTNDWSGALSLYSAVPQHSQYGDTKRIGINLSGPLIEDVLSFRLYGNLNKTDSDDYGINGADNIAGREGVRNKDLNSSFRWAIADNQYLTFDAAYSRQGNIYTGDTQNSTTPIDPNDHTIANLAKSGAETNRIYRQSYGLTYDGYWDFGETKLTFQYDKTNNTRFNEGLTGRIEGAIGSDLEFNTSRMKNYYLNGETIIPLEKFVAQSLTLGAEWTRQELDDPASSSQADALGLVTKGDRGQTAANTTSLYIEDNIEPIVGTNIIPGLRFDHHSDFGANFSPSLNFSQTLGEYFTLKAGIARAFKAPNLYQSNDGYLLLTRGNGCPLTSTTGPCYLVGNSNLDPEISINKEIGLEYQYESWQASLTYFRNDYKNKIIAGQTILNEIVNTGTNYNITQWENSGKAVIQGLEGNVKVPVLTNVSWSTNITYMIESKDKTTGNPLSIIPKFTINSMLDWKVSDKLSTFLNWTQYGRQKPMEYKTQRGVTLSDVQVGSYAQFAIGVNYQLMKNWRINGGISNLLDKQIYREAKGASTYNEPGRYYYLATTISF